jgi:O-succinylbenzoic acid--CoA ligase
VPAAELRALVRPRAWAPKQVVLVDGLPLLPGGKVDRVAVRRIAGG